MTFLVTIYKGIVSAFLTVMLFFTSFFSSTPVPNPVPKIADDASIRAVTFNLRCTGFGKTSIAFRAPLLVSQLKEIDADSMGFQEANLRWMTYLEKNLEDYDYVGVARSDGRVLGEFSPVFYKKDKYTAVDWGTFWLSKTPEKAGSKDWGSNNVRLCTWALLENKQTKERYVHLNTHLDHVSPEARENQMKVLLTKVNEFVGKYPIVLTGDFNDTVGSPMYTEVTKVLNDSCLIAPVTEDKNTYHNYGEKNAKIDFIFVSDDVTPLVYHVIDDKVNDTYLSDHYGIYVDIKI
ncbi:MAG: endonuclease/exonuclease/phosphatase family protein [Clostridia bacterium]|nr:endonuclease/exonuclease/phosphatase family protein [Clostridia bacterium]